MAQPKVVYVVTGLELGWDCICGVFDPESVTIEQLSEVFPDDQYVIFEQNIETNLDIWR